MSMEERDTALYMVIDRAEKDGGNPNAWRIKTHAVQLVSHGMTKKERSKFFIRHFGVPKKVWKRKFGNRRSVSASKFKEAFNLN